MSLLVQINEWQVLGVAEQHVLDFSASFLSYRA